MYLLNFLIAIFLPYISLFSKLAPPETIPIYFFSDEAAFVASEFCAIVFYWAGFLRNTVSSGKMTEQRYFALATVVLIFMCVSKIIFALPETWITSMFTFGLGVLSVNDGEQNLTGKLKILIVCISIIIFSYSTFILIGMAWFHFTPKDYYYYQLLFIDAFEYVVHFVKALI